MDYNINFPNLGIYLPHVGKNLSIGGFTIAYYGIVIAVGMLIASQVVTWRAKELGENPDDYMDVYLVTLLVGIIGARVYYVVFAWDAYKDDILSVFNIREGGLAIYGGIIFGILAIYFMSRFKKIKPGKAFEAAAMAVPIGQILGRWGNFFNREAFGGYTDSLFAMQLPVSAVRQHEITAEMWEHAAELDGITYIQVHPTFLYESVWNVGVLIFLFLVRKKTKFDGELFLWYLAAYGFGRFLIEPLRTDQLLVPGTAIPVSMIVAAVCVACGIGFSILGRKRAGGRSGGSASQK